MSFDNQMCEYIQRYLKEVKGQELTIDEIYQRPRWKRVWTYWEAKEHYEGRKVKEFTLEETKRIYGE